MSFINSSGNKNDWAVTANKIDALIAKVREAETVGGGLPRDILEVYWLRVEKIASDATMILKNMSTYNANRGGVLPKDVAIEGIGKRAEEFMSEIDTRISARRYLAAADTARTARIALTAPAVVREEPREPEAGTGEQPPEYGS